jgi:hypothetical protein
VRVGNVPSRVVGPGRQREVGFGWRKTAFARTGQGLCLMMTITLSGNRQRNQVVRKMPDPQTWTVERSRFQFAGSGSTQAMNFCPRRVATVGQAVRCCSFRVAVLPVPMAPIRGPASAGLIAEAVSL